MCFLVCEYSAACKLPKKLDGAEVVNITALAQAEALPNNTNIFPQFEEDVAVGHN